MTIHTLIPTHGGNNPVNGLPIQHSCCVVYDGDTLEILDTTQTSNAASEKACSLFTHNKTNALTTDLRYHHTGLTTLIGMKLNEFEHFVDNKPTHPLI